MQNWLWEMLVWTLFLKMFYLSQCCSFYMRKKEIGSRSILDFQPNFIAGTMRKFTSLWYFILAVLAD